MTILGLEDYFRNFVHKLTQTLPFFSTVKDKNPLSLSLSIRTQNPNLFLSLSLSLCVLRWLTQWFQWRRSKLSCNLSTRMRKSGPST
ncbi:hypothetical protein CFP56_026766 [Quercus suber]|uniref:Uncharacterized protein n=1 Tax=Quercus suber TaxID=58331 RepID=A0AAW0JZM2_QUESU